MDFEEVESVSWNYRQHNLLFGYGKVQEGEAFASYLIHMLVEKGQKILLFEGGTSNLYPLHPKVRAVATTKEDYQNLVEAIQEKISDREEAFEEYREENGELSATEYYKTVEPIFVLLHNITKIMANFDSKGNKALAELLKEGHSRGIIFVTIGDVVEIGKSYDDLAKEIKRSEEAVITVRLNDQNFLNVSNKQYKEANLLEDEAYYIHGSFALKMKQVREIER